MIADFFIAFAKSMPPWAFLVVCGLMFVGVITIGSFIIGLMIRADK